ncbi:hypothetical protein G6011_07477 [Alternaria panax]|uniref:Uncharacterized protein n=1 Tax=Alternaria panax TaxID=48097 RepID=A0AAD4I7J1_9PLEO|nr:hypothetical protein G6011_07477 [Alternaria panax]
MTDTKSVTEELPVKISSDEKNEATKRNTAESPLLRLPAELRNEIYKYALGRHVYPVPGDGRKNPRALNLVRVCRQIQQEAAFLPYSLSVLSSRMAIHLEEFVSRLSISQRNAIETIQLSEIGYAECSYSYWNGEDVSEFFHSGKLNGLQTVVIEKVCPAVWLSLEHQDQEIRKLAQVVRSWKAGITVMVRDYGDDVDLSVEC